MKDSTIIRVEQPLSFARLESAIRGEIEGWMQSILDEEVTEFLGRMKSERRMSVDDGGGYRNGYGEPRKLTLSSGTIELRRPRVRGLEQRFVSRILPLFKRRTNEVSELLPELYLHGLSCGDFDLALRGLLGEDAPLSASTIARLKEKWHSELSVWRSRSLEELEAVYIWADGVYIKAGIEKDKSCLLVMIAALVDGSKVILAIEGGHRESTESWSSLLRSLRDRGLKCPKAVVGDGALGLWAGLRNVYPEAKELRCWNHRIMNIVDRVKKSDQATAVELLRKIAYAKSRDEAQREKKAFQLWCESTGHKNAAKLIDEDWERMVAFFDFPKEHWQHLRTTNPVESPFASLRLRTNAAKRFKRADNATCVVWKMLIIAQSRFRKLNAPELLDEVWNGAEFVDGVRKTQAQKAPEESDCQERAAA
jgi:putative transposase